MKLKTNRVRPAILVVLILPSFAFSTWAFNAEAVLDPVHEAITIDGWKLLNGYRLAGHSFQVDATLGTGLNVVDLINVGHTLADTDQSDGGAFRHFDDESFYKASSYLVTQKDLIVKYILSGDTRVYRQLGPQQA